MNLETSVTLIVQKNAVIAKSVTCMNSLIFDDSDDDDIELEIALQSFIKQQKSYIEHFYEKVVPTYTDDEFIKFFRISRCLFGKLEQEYFNSESYQRIAQQHLVTSAGKSLAVFLWFISNEAATYRVIGHIFGLTESTVMCIIRRLICFLSSLAPREIKWPTAEEMRIESEFHHAKYGIPGIIGAVDGTHIRIDPPLINKDDYVDRKGDITVTVQAVCDHRNKILHASIGYPGSVHDARVFRVSTLPQLLDDNTPNGFRILGDSAYPCLPKLMPPYRNNGRLTAAQTNFNFVLSSSRVMIEHCFGIIKQRFRVLYYTKVRGHKKICHLIRAILVLHNMAEISAHEMQAMGIDPEHIDPSNAPPPAEENHNNRNDHVVGKQLRDVICASLPLRNRGRSSA